MFNLDILKEVHNFIDNEYEKISKRQKEARSQEDNYEYSNAFFSDYGNIEMIAKVHHFLNELEERIEKL